MQKLRSLNFPNFTTAILINLYYEQMSLRKLIGNFISTVESSLEKLFLKNRPVSHRQTTPGYSATRMATGATPVPRQVIQFQAAHASLRLKSRRTCAHNIHEENTYKM